MRYVTATDGVRLKSNVAGTLTLYLGELYAGRFDVELGQDNPPFPGKYKVHDKQVDRPKGWLSSALTSVRAPRCCTPRVCWATSSLHARTHRRQSTQRLWSSTKLARVASTPHRRLVSGA